MKAGQNHSSTLRIIIYIVAALIVLIGGFGLTYFLLLNGAGGLSWAEAVLVALPGVVFTVYLPVFRDQSAFVRFAGLGLLTVGVIFGYLVIVQQFIPLNEAVPTMVVGAIALGVTAVIALVDGLPSRISERSEVHDDPTTRTALAE